MVTTITEGKHRGDFMVSEFDLTVSREVVTLSALNGSAGHVLGQRVDDANITTAADAGNTGDGAITMEATPVGSGVAPGDWRVVCIEPATDGGRFGVYDPDGVHVGTAVVGTAFSGPIAFTIVDGATDFAAGDAFTVTVPEGTWGEYDPAATDGRDTARGVLYDNVDASAADKKVVAIVRGPVVVNKAEIVWIEGATSDQKATGLAQLAQQGIRNR